MAGSYMQLAGTADVAGTLQFARRAVPDPTGRITGFIQHNRSAGTSALAMESLLESPFTASDGSGAPLTVFDIQSGDYSYHEETDWDDANNIASLVEDFSPQPTPSPNARNEVTQIGADRSGIVYDDHGRVDRPQKTGPF